MYIKDLKINNVKCFDSTAASFNYPQKHYSSGCRPRFDNINLLLGENASGKTTVCQAICLAVLKSLLATSSSGFRSVNFIRKSTNFSTIDAKLVLADVDVSIKQVEAHTSLKRQGDNEFIEMRGVPPQWAEVLYMDDSPAIFLAAYGANRRTERPEAYNENLRCVRYQRVASLFEPHVGLVPSALAFYRNRERIAEAIQLLNRLLPADEIHNIKMKQYVVLENSDHPYTYLPEPLFDADGVDLPLSGLSDGYRIFCGWVIDLVGHLSRVIPKGIELNKASGVVIVDEIDLLLHPSWQRYVIETLAAEFPNIQFIITTHSPIVVGTLDPENIFLIERSEPHTSVISSCSQDVHGKSIDEILVKVFGLLSPRAPELERQLAEIVKKVQNGDESATLDYLKLLGKGVAQN